MAVSPLVSSGSQSPGDVRCRVVSPRPLALECAGRVFSVDAAREDHVSLLYHDLVTLPEAQWVTAVAFAPVMAPPRNGHAPYVLEVGSVAAPRLTDVVAPLMVTTNRAGVTALWSPAPGRVVPERLVVGAGQSSAVAVSPSRRMVAAADGTARIYDRRSGALLGTLDAPGARHVAFLPRGSTLVTLRDDGLLQLWDAAAAVLLRDMAGRAIPAVGLAVTTTRVVAATPGGAQVWDVAGGLPRLMLPNAEGPTTCLACSSDGSTIATAAGRHLRQWDAASGQLIRTLRGHTGRINAVAFSPPAGDAYAPGQELIASGGADGVVRLREANAGGMPVFGTLTAGDEILAVAFGPNGRTVVAATRTALHVWYIVVGAVRAEAPAAAVLHSLLPPAVVPTQCLCDVAPFLPAAEVAAHRLRWADVEVAAECERGALAVVSPNRRQPA